MSVPDRPVSVRHMKDRVYGLISVDEIEVSNSRERTEAQFEENIRSIESVGLLKPIVVNSRYREKTGHYDLVCGEGRLNAYRRLKRKTIEAEIIDVDRKQALLMSLVENMARVPPGTMWFAREVKRLHDEGMTFAEIGRITNRCESYVNVYVRLATLGEERLIRGIEQGLFPMQFALRVVEAPTTQAQHILMDAFDQNLVNAANFTQVKRILVSRMKRKEVLRNGGQMGRDDQPYTVTQLRRDISRVTRDKENFVKEAEKREKRLYALIEIIDSLEQVPGFLEMLRAENLADRPKLMGNYSQNNVATPQVG